MVSLPHAFYRLCPKQGEADCGIAALATYLRRDHAEVLIAAAHISKTVWQVGLGAAEMVKVARRLGVRTKWYEVFDIEEDIGVLWIGFNDSNKQHVVFLAEGWIFDPDHNPVSMAWHSEFTTACNGYAHQVLKVVE